MSDEPAGAGFEDLSPAYVEDIMRGYSDIERRKADQIHIESLRKLEMGLIGRLIGMGVNAPVNGAVFIALVALIGIFIVPFLPDAEGVSRADIIKILGGIVVAAFGYVAGALTQRVGHRQ